MKSHSETPTWLSALVRELRTGDKVPDGWLRLDQIQTAIGRSQPVAYTLVRAKVQAGQLQVRKFRALMPGGRIRLVNHYGPASGGTQNGSSGGKKMRVGQAAKTTRTDL